MTRGKQGTQAHDDERGREFVRVGVLWVEVLVCGEGRRGGERGRQGGQGQPIVTEEESGRLRVYVYCLNISRALPVFA